MLIMLDVPISNMNNNLIGTNCSGLSSCSFLVEELRLAPQPVPFLSVPLFRNKTFPFGIKRNNCSFV